MIMIILFILFLTTSCSNLQDAQPLNPQVYYRNDICFTYETGNTTEERIRGFFKRFKDGKYRKTQLVREKVKQCGVAVLPELDEYNISVQAYGDINFLSLTTCHEENTSENPDSGWRVKNGTTSFTYKPTIEKGKACPLYIAAFNRKQKHSWGVLVFENERYQLPSKVSCNGYVQDYLGVSVCQSREGLIQKVEFDEPVKLLKPVNGAADRKGDCPVIGNDGQSVFEFKIPNRECFYGFIGMNSKKIHQLLTIGYEQIIIRE